MSEELRNCPFCGGDAAEPWFNPEANESGGGWGEVYCSSCDAAIRSPYVSWLASDTQDVAIRFAIAAWNTRAPDTSLEHTANEEARHGNREALEAQAELLREATACLEAFTKAMDMHLGREHEWAMCDADDRARATLAKIKGGV